MLCRLRHTGRKRQMFDRTQLQGKKRITLGAFLSQGLLGMSRTFLGTALPAIRATFDLNLLQAGTFPALLQLGFSLAVFAGGPLSDTLEKRRLLASGALLIGVSLFLFGCSGWHWVALLCITLVGVAGGLIESSSNPLLVQLFRGREASVMNIHHFFFAVGSLSGPLVVGAALTGGLTWQEAYRDYGLAALLVSGILLWPGIPPIRLDRPFDRHGMVALLRDPAFLTLFAITFLSVGTQNSIAYWLVTFLKEGKGYSIGVAGTSLSLFFICLAIGRLITSYLITQFRETVYLLTLFCLVLITLALVISLPGFGALPFIGLCGLAQAGVFPSLLGRAGRLYAKTPGTALGLIATGTGVGSMVIAWLVSLVAQLAGLYAGFALLELVLGLCILLMIFHIRQLGARPASESADPTGLED
jgi:FHS family glucose/mannose:H+ symporter-like MFS transporter